MIRLSNTDDVMLLRYIDGYTKVHGIPPSIREIMRELGLQSTSPARHRIERLEKAGYVKRTPLLARAMRITTAGYKAMKQYEKMIEKVTEAMRAA